MVLLYLIAINKPVIYKRLTEEYLFMLMYTLTSQTEDRYTKVLYCCLNPKSSTAKL